MKPSRRTSVMAQVGELNEGEALLRNVTGRSGKRVFDALVLDKVGRREATHFYLFPVFREGLPPAHMMGRGNMLAQQANRASNKIV